jgi:pyruvate dehydrogenase E1 component
LRREALDVERWNLLHPADRQRDSYITKTLSGSKGPFIASTDYMKVVADQIRQWVPGRYVVLGTDGYGRSDGRAALRRHFEVDRHYIVAASLKALADEGKLEKQIAQDYVARHIDASKPNPASL